MKVCKPQSTYAAKPKLTFEQSLIPVVMSGIIAVYSLVIAVLIAGDMGPPPQQNYSLFKYECVEDYQCFLG